MNKLVHWCAWLLSSALEVLILRCNIRPASIWDWKSGVVWQSVRHDSPSGTAHVRCYDGMSYHMLMIIRWKNHSVGGSWTDENLLVGPISGSY